MLLRHILFMNYHRHSGTQCKTHPITYLFSPPSFSYIHLYVSGDVPDDTSPLCIHYKPINYPKRSILLHIIIVIIIFHFYDYYYWTGVRSPCGHRKSSFLLGNESTRCLFNIGEERKKNTLPMTETRTMLDHLQQLYIWIWRRHLAAARCTRHETRQRELNLFIYLNSLCKEQEGASTHFEWGANVYYVYSMSAVPLLYCGVPIIFG